MSSSDLQLDPKVEDKYSGRRLNSYGASYASTQWDLLSGVGPL